MGVLAYLDANEPALARVDDMVLGQSFGTGVIRGQQQSEGGTWVIKVIYGVDVCEGGGKARWTVSLSVKDQWRMGPSVSEAGW